MPDGLLDTNVFIHAHTADTQSEECRRFLLAVEVGEVRARLEPLILHELSYALPHYLKQMQKADVAAYLLMVLGWNGVRGEIDTMVDAVQRWRDTPGLSFADAFLAALALARETSVYTKNVREIRAQGCRAPSPLPSALRGPEGTALRSPRPRDPSGPHG